MNICFYIQNNHVQKMTAPVAEFARRHGIDCHDRSSIQGMGPDDWNIDWTKYDKVIPIGSVQFIAACKDSSIGKHLMYNYSYFSPAYIGHCLGRLALNYEDRIIFAKYVATLLTSDRSYHIKPTYEHKLFHGQVYTKELWAETYKEKFAEHRCNVSEVKPILKEWRFFVIDGKVISGSQYMVNGELEVSPGCPAEPKEFAQFMVDAWKPFPNFVIDVCSTPAGYRVVELNSIHSSGWYDCDVDMILTKWVRSIREGRV